MHLLLMLCILGGRSVTSDRLTQEGREVGDLRSVIQILGVGAARAGVHGARLVSYRSAPGAEKRKRSVGITLCEAVIV